MRHGSQIDPANRFDAHSRTIELEHLEWDQEYLRKRHSRPIEYLPDDSKTIVASNNSPDIPFRYSVNPYRGCAHACSYCYARPTHEYLGLNAGLDFETKIVVKRDAARLLKAFLARDSWEPEPIIFSGVTDCYQPAERTYRLTRECLKVALECRQPIGIITKNALVVRDLDLLKPMAADHLVQVFISINSLDVDLVRDMEPRASIPAARLRALSMLADAGVPTGVMVAPVIPGLNESEIPAVLEAAKDAGALAASYVMLRLPQTVAPVFAEWLERTRPLKAQKVLQLVRDARGGKLNDSEWGQRMVGTGAVANQFRDVFQLFVRRFELNKSLPGLDASRFQRPLVGQLRLF